jgi:predicted NBD/HSP70 family sugar kinase
MNAASYPAGTTRIGVDLGGTKMLVIVDSNGRHDVFRFDTGPAASLETIRAQMLAVVARYSQPCIGIAIPGIVDSQGTVQDCDVLPRLAGWNPMRDIPGVAAVCNDGEAALATTAEGEAPDATVAAIGCGTGIAAAFQVAGRRLRQYRPYSGELGFAPFGRDGSFDDHASGAALLRRLQGTGAEIAARLEARDEASLHAVQAAGEAFGLSLVTVLHMLHPSRIGLYGGTLRYAGYLDAAFAAFERFGHPLLRASCRVGLLDEPDFAVAHGAILHALRR